MKRFEINNNDLSNPSYTLIKKLCYAAEISMAELVNRRNALHPTAQTTPQNLSGKLKRDSLKLSEFIELTNCAGFKIIFEEITQDKTLVDFQGNPIKPQMEKISDSKPHRRDEARIVPVQKSFDELLEEDFTELTSINFESALVAGKQCNEAAAWIEEKLSTDISQSKELLLYARASKMYGVKIRPVS